MKHFVYILKSQKDGNHYTGMTRDVSARLLYHNLGKVRSTKNRRPFVVIYQEEFNSLGEARSREKYLKSYQGSKEKLKILSNS